MICSWKNIYNFWCARVKSALRYLHNSTAEQKFSSFSFAFCAGAVRVEARAYILWKLCRSGSEKWVSFLHFYHRTFAFRTSLLNTKAVFLKATLWRNLNLTHSRFAYENRRETSAIYSWICVAFRLSRSTCLSFSTTTSQILCVNPAL